jgi:hypothetical protein
MEKREIIRKNKIYAEFYLKSEDATKRYNELLKKDIPVYMDYLFKGKLWVVTSEQKI